MVPWSCETATEGGTGFVIFSMINPTDSPMQVSMDPTAFNAGGDPAAAGGSSSSRSRVAELVAEQNVRVLTAPFETAIGRFNELVDVSADFGDDTDNMKALKEMDDLGVIPERKLHKILVRLRFEGAVQDRPWVFYCSLNLAFSDPERREHRLGLVLRFARPQPGGGLASCFLGAALRGCAGLRWL